MRIRLSLIITAVLACHLFLVPPLLTSQLPASISPSAAPEEAEIRAEKQQLTGNVYTLSGNAEIHYGEWILNADEITYDKATGDAKAQGHVVLQGGGHDEYVQASQAEYNIRLESGKFYDVSGSIGLRSGGGRTALVSETPFLFTGKLVEKTGPNHFIVHHGTVTSCELPHPKWLFSSQKVVVEVGGDARLYHSTFKIRGVPVLYFPFATHPVKPYPRESGFLVPTFGHSNLKGTVFGDSFYWAINRSADVTLGAQFFSRRGWSQNLDFRMRPSPTSYIDLNFYGVLDRGVFKASTTVPGTMVKVDEGGQDVRLNAESRFPLNFRGVANIEYLSSYLFRIVFGEVYNQVVNSEVKSTAFLSRNSGAFSYNALVQRYQNFQSTNAGDVVTIHHAPSFQIGSVDQHLGRSPFVWSFDAAADGLARSEPSFRTATLIGRFDLSPRISLPLHWKGWGVRPELTLRDTLYTQEFIPSSTGPGAAVSNLVSRKALEGSVELLPPALERIFGGGAGNHKFKHVIEPRLTYRYLTGVSNFSEILRFDSRDILSNTHEVEYALVQRLFAKGLTDKRDDCQRSQIAVPIAPVTGTIRGATTPWMRSPENPCPKVPETREIIRWELAQKYFLDPEFGGALVNGRRNMLTTTADFTGIAFLTDPRHLSPIISRLNVRTSNRSEAEWDLDYDVKKARISASTAIVSYHLGQFTVGGSDNFLQTPGEIVLSNTQVAPTTLHQFRVLLGYGNPSRRGFNAATNWGFDANAGFLQYMAVQTNYNWNCCGINMEYRRFAIPGVRNENQYRFSFTLANIGAFGNMRRQERLF
jgi:LPS-assembly protein